MVDRHEALRARLLQTFRLEADERLQILADGLVALEREAHPAALIESLFREIHNLKGAARAVTLLEVERLCQSWEGVFSALKKGALVLAPAHLDLSHQALALLRQAVEGASADPAHVDMVCQALEQAISDPSNSEQTGRARETGSAAVSAAGQSASGAPLDAGQTFQGSRPSPGVMRNQDNPLGQENSLSQGSPPAEGGRSGLSTQELSIQDLSAQEPLSQGLQSLEQPAQESAVGATDTSEKPQDPADAADESRQSLAVALKRSRPARTLKVEARQLDTVWFQAEELLESKLIADDHLRSISQSLPAFSAWRHHRNELLVAKKQLRKHLGQLDRRTQRELSTLLEFCDWAPEFLDQWEFRLGSFAKSASRLSHQLGRSADALRCELQNVMLLPCATLVAGLPAMVREIAVSAGKKVFFSVRGESLKVDKRVLDEIRSPLQHLIRNAIDHGIETPAERLRKQKAEEGRLLVEFRQDASGKLELTVTDDGRGLNPEHLKEQAAALGGLTPEQREAMSREEAFRLIFLSGLSTSPMITDLSGRGLGMAIVQEKVEQLGGNIEIQSEADRGCTFILRLPSSLATYRALLVRTAERLLAIPAHAVERVVRLPIDAVFTLESRTAVRLGEDLLPLWRLADLLELTSDTLSRPQWAQLVVLGTGDDRFALWVDEVQGDQEITVKSLGSQLKRVRNVMGATQLGNGQVVPILNPLDLYKSARQAQSPVLAFDEAATPVSRKRILVAEDSVTSRSLLKNILESAGYEVVTTADGLEAWGALKQASFDLLLSDIEMPHLSGFALTAKVRDDAALKDLPVVLVTALQSAEDRARGLEVGANAYIVKSGFDQNSLIDAIGRLI